MTTFAFAAYAILALILALILIGYVIARLVRLSDALDADPPHGNFGQSYGPLVCVRHGTRFAPDAGCPDCAPEQAEKVRRHYGDVPAVPRGFSESTIIPSRPPGRGVGAEAGGSRGTQQVTNTHDAARHSA